MDCLIGDLSDDERAVFGRVASLSAHLADLLGDALSLLPEKNEGAACTSALCDALEAVEAVAVSMRHHFGHVSEPIG